jgi:monoamine oxidase
MQVWENGYSQPGPRGLLVAYTKFAGARELDALDENQRVAMAVDAVSRVHPELPRHLEGGRSKSWDQDPWARGAFAILRPGDVMRLEPHIARADGRITSRASTPRPGSGRVDALGSRVRRAGGPGDQRGGLVQ